MCEEDGAVIPRGGLFPEGPQPAGDEGWSRPLALEPISLGVLLGPDAEIRWHLPLDEAPDSLIAAIIAAEDEAFYDHIGVDPMGLARAAWINYQGGSFQQGASTLSMQVVRNLNQRKEKTIARKLREIAAAVALDQQLGKEGVLQLYLDAPYLGQAGSLSICGFRAASMYYWGVDVDELTLGQQATLAAILPAPGRFSPNHHPEKARARRDMVLQRMAKAGWDVTEALAEPVEAGAFAPLPPVRHPAYLQAARAWLESTLPAQTLYGAGLTVFTALDFVAPQTTETLLSEKVKYLQRIVGKRGEGPLETAGAVIDPSTGHLVAVYGGTQASATDFSRATQARRQAGSSFKPVVYAMAFAQEGPDGLPLWRAHHTVPNSRRVFENTDGWRPRNISGDYSATTTLAMGLAWSKNVAAASLLEAAGGPEALIEFATRIGYDTSLFRPELGLALGQGEVTPFEQARFVATIISGGLSVTGSPITVALDPRRVVRWREPALGEPVMSPEAAALTRALMRLVIEFGTGGSTRGGGGFAGYGGPAIGKTGTTDQEKDLWFIGGTPDFAAAVWLGYDKPARIGGSASDLASPLWGWWMRALEEGHPERDFDDTVKLTRRSVCTISGRYSNGSCHLIAAPFLGDDKPDGICHIAHPPPDPEKKKYEGLWKRRKREAEERAAAQEAAQSAADAPEAAGAALNE